MEATPDNSGNLSSSFDVEDTIDIAVKNWDRIISAAKKAGYREGIEDGSESVFQEGFDRGYEDAFEIAFTLGKYKSLLNAMPPNEQHPLDIIEILNKTGRGVCYICKEESQSKNDHNQQEAFPEIVNKQKAHSKEIIKRLHQYFAPVIQNLNANVSHLLDTESYVSDASKNKSLKSQSI